MNGGLNMNDKKEWSASKNVQQDYIDICKKALENDYIFNNFKRDSRYKQVLEHVSGQLGERHLKHIIPELLEEPYLSKFKENDKYGNPGLSYYNKTGEISATTLRYIDVLSNIITWIPDAIEGHIVEIGGGYGGQCKIIYDYVTPKSYMMLDLPVVTKLQRKYLELFNIPLTRHPDSPVDFVISNYAWSELSDELRSLYIDTIISNAKHGYITTNRGLYMIDEIKESVDADVFVYEDVDWKHPNNKIVVW